VRRWHTERDLMLRRWRFEIAIHEYPAWPHGGLAPIPPVICDDSCHCYRGCGFFRDRHPLDCGRPRCGCCHAGKWDRRRQNDLREAIDREWDASGGW
jgi:hypothetical protein